MEKAFFVNGFLYHAPSQQILLHQPDEEKVNLSVFSGKSEDGESPEEVFQNIITSQLGIDLPKNSIHAVYNYLSESQGGRVHVLFSEVKEIDLDFDLSETGTVGWFPLKLIPKLHLSKQDKHDIVIGQRVIAHLERQRQEQLAGEEI